MKRNSEENFVQDMQSKRFISPLSNTQQYISQNLSQQSNQAGPSFQYIPYPGNLMYPRPQWPQHNRYGHPTNLPPPPSTPPPINPPPPPANNLAKTPQPIFDLTQPPPPIRQNLTSVNSPSQVSPHLPSTSSGLLQPRLPNMLVRPSVRGRATIFRGTQIRQRALFNLRNSTLPHNGRATNFVNGITEDTESKRVLVNKKSKRKPMSARYMRSKEWEREDAEKALELEKEYNKMQRTPMLILKFPDPDLNKHIVKKYSSAIETVHFQQPSTPRYCFVTLKDGSDLEKVKKELCEIPFGTKKIVAEQKFSSHEENQPVSPEEIDPYTLYIGNLPTKICVNTVKEHFPAAARYDIGYAQRMKYTRYAFIRYDNVEDAMEAYRRTFNTLIGNRSLIVRFRRSKGNIGLPGESRIPNVPKKVQPITKDLEKKKDTEMSPDVEGLKELSTDKDDENEIPILVHSDELEEDEEEDSKENVLDEARKMRESMNNEENVRAIKQEDEYDNESEKDRNNSMNNISLLGTRIKEEYMDDDELIACARTYSMDDEFDEEEPDDEDDFSANRSGTILDSTKLETPFPITNRFNDESDIKPDILNLPHIPYSTSIYGYNYNKYDYSRNRTNDYRSSIERSSSLSNRETNDKDEDDEEDIFDGLNEDFEDIF